MKNILLIVFMIYYSIGLHGQSEKIFPSQALTSKDCDGDIVTGTVGLWGLGGEQVKVFNITSDLCEMQLSSNGQQILSTDTLFTPNHEHLEIDFQFKNYNTEEKVIKYSTLDFKEEEIPIHLSSYYITAEEVSSEVNKTINFKDNCSDSIDIYFPHGGTVSSLTIHTNSTDEEYIKAIAYGFGDENNYIRFARTETGKYYIRYGACHWAANFWLELADE